MSNARKALAADAAQEEDPQPELAAAEPAQTYTFSRTALLQQAVTANELLKQVAVRPIRGQENQIQGYFIDQVPPGSILEEAGIRNGDVIVSIEGRSIGSMQDAWSAFNAIKGRSTFEIVLLRNNKPLTVRYALTN
jgi:type II secretory pathway component PulC